MKAKAKIARRIIGGLVMVAILALVGIVGLVSCGGQEEQLVENGPNAGLSNDELVRQAISNMAALRSYHVEVQGLTTSTISNTPSITLTYDQSGRATVGNFVYRGAGSSAEKSLLNMDSTLHPGAAPLRVDMNILVSGEGQQGSWYESYDEGKTWEAGFGGWGPSLIPLGTFGSIQNGEGSPMGYPRILGGLSGLAFKDGSPRLEKIDNTLTRHVKTEFPKPEASTENPNSLMQLFGGSSVELWVTTEVTPTIRRMFIEGRTEQSVEKKPLRSVDYLEFSPDGKTLAVAHSGVDGEGVIRLWDLTSPGSDPRTLELRLTNDSPNTIAYRPDSIAYSPDSKWLAASARVYGEPKSTGRVYLWDLSGQSPSPIILTTPEVSEVADLVFKPGARLLAYLGDVYAWDISVTNTEGTLVHSIGAGGVNAFDATSAAAFSPDCSMLAVAGVADDLGRPKGVWLFDLEHPDVPVVTHSTGDEVATRVKFSPAGKLLVSNGDYRVRVWDLAHPEKEPIVLPGEWIYAGIAFTNDGKYLAVTGGENQVTVYETAAIFSQSAVAPTAMVLPVDGTIFSLAYSPDSKLLAAGDLDGRVWIFQAADLSVDGASKAEPTLLVEQGAGETQVIRGPTCSLTWKWSRFNEDFGEVKPPPTATGR